jgi:hypothetical protein
MRDLFQKRKLLAIVLIALFILISPWLYHRVMGLYNAKVCTMNDGEWVRGGMAETQFCLYSYEDGGKSCSSSEECMGACVIYESPIQGQPTPSIGVCKDNNNPFECFAIIEYPEMFGCAD